MTEKKLIKSSGAARKPGKVKPTTKLAGAQGFPVPASPGYLPAKKNLAAFGAQAMLDEVERAMDLHPWPEGLIHQVAIMMEEAGEVIKAANDYVHHGGSLDEVIRETIHTGATCLRLLDNLDYVHQPRVQEKSSGPGR